MYPNHSTTAHALRRCSVLGLLLSLLLAMLPSANLSVAIANGAARVQPQLQMLVAHQPDRLVNVIVQKTATNADVEQVARSLGATVLRDLSIINAFEASMAAAVVLDLAAHPHVRWISLNNPVASQEAMDVATTWASALGSYDLERNSRSQTFDNVPIQAGSSLWFSSIVKISSLPHSAATFTYTHSTIEFTAEGIEYSLPVPDGQIRFSPAVSSASTTFDAATQRWITTVPVQYGGEIFLSGLPFAVPAALPGGIRNVRWSGRMTSDAPGTKVQWRWAAAVYSRFSTNPAALLVKPISQKKNNPYTNSDPAGSPQAFSAYTIPGARGKGGTDAIGAYTSWREQSVTFQNLDLMVDAPSGPVGTFATAGRGMAALSGFAPAMPPGYLITRVELLVSAYVPAPISADPQLLIVRDDGSSVGMTLPRTRFNAQRGAARHATIAFDISHLLPWNWSDFSGRFEIVIDQTNLNASQSVAYDAIGLRISSVPGGPLVPLDRWQPSDSGRLIDSAKLRNAYNFAVQAPQLWNQHPVPLQGQGVTVAVVDSGIFKTQDLKDAVAGNANFSKANRLSDDQYGHGTFVAGLIAGNGKSSDGAYIGIAPRANLLNVRISDDQGMATEADVVEALQWLHEHHSVYNVRVVNLSLNAATPQSYHSSPMAAAVEVLWFSGIVVVVSAGNNGVNSPGVLLPPANDPFVITVGAADDKGTASIQDDVVAPFSAYGTTPEGFAKPELVAPGVRLVAPLPSNDYLNMSRNRDANRIDKDYFRMSGTSMAAPIVSGAVALLLQDEPHLTPDQVKHRLVSTANKSWPGYSPAHAGAGYLDIYAAVHANSSASANTGVPASQLLWTGPDPVTWSSVNWGSVNWGSVNWGSVNWGSDYWEGE